MNSLLRVLNLEDNEDDATLNQHMLSARWPQMEFQRVDTEGDFTAAIEQGKVDLILSDHTMPGFSGLRALALAQEKCPRVPFLFVSGTIGEDTAIESLKSGATDYVLKHRLMRLIPVVARALREQEHRAEQEHAEHALRESENKYRQVFECLGDAVFLADELSGQIIDLNSRAEVLLGCKRSEILRHRQSHFLPSLNPREMNLDESVETELIRPDGAPLRVRIHSTRLTINNRPLVLQLCQALVKSPNQTGVEPLLKPQAPGIERRIIPATETLPETESRRRPRLQRGATLLKPFTIEKLLRAVLNIMAEANSTESSARLLRDIENNPIPQTNAPGETLQPCSPNPSRRILVVEADNDVRQLMVEVLADAGYDVECVGDGAAGREALQAKSYALVITDDEISGPTDIEVNAPLRAACLPLPVILVTRYLPIHDFDRQPLPESDATRERPFDDLLGEF